jgi:sec-independent protein translocase protein TatC
MSPEPANAPGTSDDAAPKLTFWDHLRELRKRLLYSIYGLLVGTLLVGWKVGVIVDKLMEPVLAALKPPVLTAGARAALQAALAGPGLAEPAHGALLECATQPVVSDHAKEVLEQFSRTPDLGKALLKALDECADMASTIQPVQKLVYTSAIEPMMVYIKVGIYGGVFVAAPFILYQLWQFVAPGLYKKEKRVVVPFLAWGTALFYAGAIFCYQLVLPAAFPAMLQFSSAATMTPMLAISEQLGLVMAMLLGFGVVFEYPVIIAFLAMVGLVTPQFLTKYRRHAIVVNTLLAALITPTGDPLNLALMAVPMCLFYEIGIILARVLGKKPAEATATGAPVSGA